MLPQKYIIAVLGDAYEGKTTTINKTFNKLAGSKIISGVTSVWGPLPSPSNVVDFSLTGITKYGLTGFWIKFDRPKDVSKDEYTDELSNKIFYLFK